MRWELPWPKLAASGTGDEEKPDGWQRHVEALRKVAEQRREQVHQQRGDQGAVDDQPAVALDIALLPSEGRFTKWFAEATGQMVALPFQVICAIAKLQTIDTTPAPARDSRLIHSLQCQRP